MALRWEEGAAPPKRSLLGNIQDGTGWEGAEGSGRQRQWKLWRGSEDGITTAPSPTVSIGSETDASMKRGPGLGVPPLAPLRGSR